MATDAIGPAPALPVASGAVVRLKPFRAVRFDPGRAGPLENLVAPPHDVVTPAQRELLLAASPHNVIRLSRPSDPEEAGELFRAWLEEGVLVRDASPAVWLLEETFEGPDGARRTRRSLVARIRVTPYGEGGVYPHERTFRRQKLLRLDLLRAVRAKLSPVLLLHDGPALEDPGAREPDIEVDFEGVHIRLWRIDDPAEIAAALAATHGPFVIADGHHRYETGLRFHEEEGTEETAYILAALVSRDDPGLEIYPTHRLVSGPIPDIGGFRLTELGGGADESLARLAEVPRDRPAFVLVRSDGSVLAEGEPSGGLTEVLDAAALDALDLGDVRYTAQADEAEEAVRTGTADAAFLVRAPTIDQVEAVALAGETMPEKSTYFFPKLTSGLLIAPFDE
jgi:uncharacterized protein (DUF1015 family)